MQLVHGLHFNNLRGDIYGGLTAAVVALPLALAMGVSSGAGPIAGIYGAIFVGLFAALFGGTPAQVSGPTGPMTVVMAAIFTQYTAMFPDRPEYGATLAFTVVIMGGLLQIVFGVLKLGRFINLIPHPVVSGFMSGIGVIIILLQLGPLFGHATQPGPMASLNALPGILAAPVGAALMMGGLALLIVYLLPQKINRIVPSPLMALIVGTLVLFFWQGGEISRVVVDGSTRFMMGDVSVLGDIPTGIPSPMWPVLELDLLVEMLKSALILAALGSIDSLLTSLVADNVTHSYHESNRELIGQGIGNTLAGLFGGLPGAGATMRTVVNVRAGGLTPISGALHALVLLAIVLGAGVVASYIPHALLAGILVKVGTDIIDWDYLKRLKHAPKGGVAIMFVVLIMTVFVDLVTAVAIGMIMASFLFMQRMVDLQINSINTLTGPQEGSNLSEQESAILAEAGGRILLFQVSGPMSFGAAKGTARRLARFDAYDDLIIDLSEVPQIDYTSSRAVDDMLHSAWDSGREAFIVGCRPQVANMLKKQGITARFSEDELNMSRLDILKTALAHIQARQST
ncbi:SulP family inorganic anion transporter [Sulfuriflexus mobilis]|uniref:SulP family inorganic anion transporter n=1 Tax=Sulfuriflexus mobilis TaxID=1811807 RepID=UPI000F818155|nr:SulP family inorganic anion transporter [Sulfuriflexus mobilis]